MTTEDEVIAKLSRGLLRCEEAAWQEFHARYYDFLLGRVRMRGIAESDGPEAVQRIYLRVLKHAKPFARQADFEAWLACLARSEAIDTARGATRRSWLREKLHAWRQAGQRSQAAVEEHPMFAVEDYGSGARLDEALRALDGKDRSLVTRHYLGGWSQEELAGELGVTVKAVESRLARLRVRLRTLMEEEDPEACA